MKKRLLTLFYTVLIFGLIINLSGHPINYVGAKETPEQKQSPAKCEAFAQKLINNMTDEEKVGQLFILGATNPGSEPTEVERRRIQEFGYGGFIFSGLKDPRQTASYINQLQEWAEETRLGIPVFAASDMEWGASHQFTEIGPEEGKPTPVPFPMGLGATRNLKHAETAARITATEARAMGLTMNFAPIADVNTNPNNPVIGVRSFGEESGLVSDMVAAQVSAYQKHGVIAAAKHFPGHGDTAQDSHTGLPIVTYDRETLEEVHLAPFQAAIDAGVDSIMTAHVIVKALDPDLPATLSRKVLTDQLREEMGFDGVIITDSMGMEAISNKWGTEQAAVMAIKAGADIILSVSHKSYEGILEALRTGELSEERINESVKRILKLKCKYGLFEDSYVDPDNVVDSVGTEEHIRDSKEISRDSITLIKNNGVLPLNPKQRNKTILVTGQTSGAFRNVLPPIADTVRKKVNSSVVDMGWPVNSNPSDKEIENVVRKAENVDKIIVATYSSGKLPEQQIKLVNELVETEVPVIVVSLGLPYDLKDIPEVDAYLASYALNVNPMASIQSVEAAIEVVFGEQPGGKLPVTIGDLYNYGHGLQYKPVKNSAEIKELVEEFEQEGKFSKHEAVRTLTNHLTAVNMYEEKGLSEKVVKHMENFKLLLDYQKEKELISKEAYNILKENSNSLIKMWQ